MKPDAKILFVDGTSGAAGDMVLGMRVDQVRSFFEAVEDIPALGVAHRDKDLRCVFERRNGKIARLVDLSEYAQRDAAVYRLEPHCGAIDDSVARAECSGDETSCIARRKGLETCLMIPAVKQGQHEDEKENRSRWEFNYRSG